MVCSDAFGETSVVPISTILPDIVRRCHLASAGLFTAEELHEWQRQCKRLPLDNVIALYDQPSGLDHNLDEREYETENNGLDGMSKMMHDKLDADTTSPQKFTTSQLAPLSRYGFFLDSRFTDSKEDEEEDDENGVMEEIIDHGAGGDWENNPTGIYSSSVTLPTTRKRLALESLYSAKQKCSVATSYALGASLPTDRAKAQTPAIVHQSATSSSQDLSAPSAIASLTDQPLTSTTSAASAIVSPEGLLLSEGYSQKAYDLIQEFCFVSRKCDSD